MRPIVSHLIGQHGIITAAFLLKTKHMYSTITSMGQAVSAPVSRPSGLKRASELVNARELVDGSMSGGLPDRRWGYPALKGRMTELVGDSQSANVSLAIRLILEAQHAGEFAAWVATHRDVFFPPDVAAAGVDLAALPVIFAEHPQDVQPGSNTAQPSEPTPQSPSTTQVGSASRPHRGVASAPPGRVESSKATNQTTASLSARRQAAAAACRAAERLLRSGAFGLVVIDLARDLPIAPASQGRLLRLAETHDAQVLILRRKQEDGRYEGSLVTVRCESAFEQSAPGRFRVSLTNTKDKREGPGWTRTSEFDGPPGLY